jgi:hypothetical protein
MCSNSPEDISSSTVVLISTSASGSGINPSLNGVVDVLRNAIRISFFSTLSPPQHSSQVLTEKPPKLAIGNNGEVVKANSTFRERKREQIIAAQQRKENVEISSLCPSLKGKFLQLDGCRTLGKGVGRIRPALKTWTPSPTLTGHGTPRSISSMHSSGHPTP